MSSSLISFFLCTFCSFSYYLVSFHFMYFYVLSSTAFHNFSFFSTVVCKASSFFRHVNAMVWASYLPSEQMTETQNVPLNWISVPNSRKKICVLIIYATCNINEKYRVKFHRIKTLSVKCDRKRTFLRWFQQWKSRCDKNLHIKRSTSGEKLACKVKNEHFFERNIAHLKYRIVFFLMISHRESERERVRFFEGGKFN